MGSTNKTANIELPQFVDADKPTWRGDINSAFSDIDGKFGTVDGVLNTKITAAAAAALIAAQHATDDTTYVRVFTPQEYGAIGDGIADDTLACQTALDAACGGPPGANPSPIRFAVGTLYLPPGDYRITAPLVIKSTIGLSIHGAGPRQSRLRVDGTMDCAFSAIGCPTLTVHDFAINGYGGWAGSGQVIDAIRFDNIPAESAGWDAGIRIERVFVEELRWKNGFSFGRLSTFFDLSAVHAVDCESNGQFIIGSGDTTLYQAAYYDGSGISGNILNHHFDHCIGADARWLYRLDSNWMVTISKASCSRVESAVHKSGPGIVVFRDARVEESKRLITTVGGAGYVVSLSLDNVIWSPGTHGASDKQVIQWWYPGHLAIKQLHLEQSFDDTAPWLFNLLTGGSGNPLWAITVDINGIVSTNPTPRSLFDVAAGNRVYAEIRGYQQATYADGVLGQPVGYQEISFGAAPLNMSPKLIPTTVGNYRCAEASGSTTYLTTNEQFYAMPFLVNAESETFDRITGEVTVAGETGSLIRLGIYRVDNATGDLHELILDAGTIDGTALGVQQITINTTLPVGIYAVGAVAQNAPTTPPTIRGLTPRIGQIGVSSPTFTGGWYYPGAIAAALIADMVGWSPAGLSSCPAVFLRKSA